MYKMNPQQNEAVRYIDGPLLVLAGAGSGKTRVITQKIVHLVKKCGLPPTRIAAVTFTNKASKEMKSRVGASLGKEKSRGLMVSTFHTLGLKVIREEHKHLGLKSSFSIYDAQDCQNLLKQLAPKNLLKDQPLELVQQKFSAWKNHLLKPEDLSTQAADDPAVEYLSDLYSSYLHHLKIYNAVDFDDLIALPVSLFMNTPDILNRWQNKIRYMLVDEYQDTNASQYALVRQLVGVRGALTVVGDDDQSIYAWRGAQPENLALLQRDFPTLKVIKLEQNYRSTGCILKAANEVISGNTHVFSKRLWSDHGFGEKINVLVAKDEEHEAERVVSNLLHHKFQNRTEFRDYAILYRGNHQSRLFEKCLREHQIPYRISGGPSFFSFTEVKDIVAYLRLMANSDDNQAFLRVVNTPRREIGPSTIEKLAQYADHRAVSLCEAAYELGLQQVLPERAVGRLRHFVEWLALMSDRAQRGELLPAIRDMIKEIDYAAYLEDISRDKASAERKMENIHELLEWVSHMVKSSEKEPTLSELVGQMMLMDILDRDEDNDNSDRVTLMTLHSAKGLEFPHVFIVGMVENTLPHYACLEGQALEEERRLLYVGMTRAERSLTLSYTSQQKRAGEMMDCEPSRFLAEIPQDTIDWQRNTPVDPQIRQQRGRAHLENLRGILGTNPLASEQTE